MSCDEEVAQRVGSLPALSGLTKKDNIHLLTDGMGGTVMETWSG